MAKIFRISGYYVDEQEHTVSPRILERLLTKRTLDCEKGCFQQLHIEESEKFEIDGENVDNCDLALLTRHFKKDIPTEYDRPLPKAGEKYRHFKIGKVVTIIGISRHTETEEISVIYDYDGHIWNRPLDMFMSEVDREKYPDAEQEYRFEKVDD